jgi:hypothetical protein
MTMLEYKTKSEIATENSVDVQKIRALLGEDVLLLHWSLGTKGERRNWKHLTIDAMSDATYIETLSKGNVGVALGEVSNGLCAIDIDRDELVVPFLDCNPLLADTLQTHGARGRVFWVRLSGEYPDKFDLKSCYDSSPRETSGEFRSRGHQSIIAGIHPVTNQPYQFIVEAKPVVIDFGAIVWPEEFGALSRSGNTLEEEGAKDAEATFVSSVSSVQSESASVKVFTLEELVARTRATKSGQSDRLLFTLARGVKTLELRHATKYTPQYLRYIFGMWYDRSKDVLRPNESKEDYLFKFLRDHAGAKFPLGNGAIAKAAKLTLEMPLPPEAFRYKKPERRLLVGLCWQLQIINGKEPFFLSGRDAGRFLNHKNHTTAADWLIALCQDGVIREVKKGGPETMKATRYFYLSEDQKEKVITDL